MFTPENPPADDDYTPEAMSFRKEHPDLYPNGNHEEPSAAESESDPKSEPPKSQSFHGAVVSEANPPPPQSATKPDEELPEGPEPAPTQFQ